MTCVKKKNLTRIISIPSWYRYTTRKLTSLAATVSPCRKTLNFTPERRKYPKRRRDLLNDTAQKNPSARLTSCPPLRNASSLTTRQAELDVVTVKRPLPGYQSVYIRWFSVLPVLPNIGSLYLGQ